MTLHKLIKNLFFAQEECHSSLTGRQPSPAVSASQGDQMGL
jgi:hypothetical protein